MSTFVLVHGAWHGGWCWYKVIPILEKEGHKVLAPDLPSHGRDKMPVSAISLQSYTDRICNILDAQPEPVILVGHSMGGIVISQAAEYRPSKIKTLVYVAAFLLQDGETLLHVAESDTDELVLKNLLFAEDRSYAQVREEALKQAFYEDCSDEDLTLAKSLLVPQATAPLGTPIHTTQEKFGRLRRVYVECLRDNAIRPPLQKRMHSAMPCERVLTMNTSHSPFFASPDGLASHLLSAGP